MYPGLAIRQAGENVKKNEILKANVRKWIEQKRMPISQIAREIGVPYALLHRWATRGIFHTTSDTAPFLRKLVRAMGIENPWVETTTQPKAEWTVDDFLVRVWWIVERQPDYWAIVNLKRWFIRRGLGEWTQEQEAAWQTAYPSSGDQPSPQIELRSQPSAQPEPKPHEKSIEELVGLELLEIAKRKLEIAPDKWQGQVSQLKPDQVPDFTDGLFYRIGLIIRSLPKWES